MKYATSIRRRLEDIASAIHTIRRDVNWMLDEAEIDSTERQVLEAELEIVDRIESILRRSV
jgi:hypothetical protein